MHEQPAPQASHEAGPRQGSLLLTQSEIERLGARAAGEVRPVANYVAWVIEPRVATLSQRSPGSAG